ncbi:beta-ketoacyl-[acyl-carrier-protein] synthase family protein [Actinokineospora guangxiensis]|uniref:Beta-ketoacyl-[acyl-carrier-protein] synthase family protein n=1 Tax=Actinokineospora guangxiensis TaxID=1490288 RepID=A0ABW0EK24_9PSEU
MSWGVIGTGALAGIGRTAEEVFDALCAGRSGIGALRGFDQALFKADRLYEVDNRGDGDRPRRATELLLDAVAMAVAEAGIGDDLAEVPVLVGTGLRELRSVELWATGEAALDASALHFGGALRERFGARDAHTFANACSASLYALALGADLLDAGAADTVVVAGVDVITETMFGVSDRVQMTPPEAIRPFDRARAGTILGEGAVAVVLSRDPRAPAVGRLRSVGVTCDAFHSTAPDAAGIRAAVHEAHRRAGVKPDDIDLVVMHGTGTQLNDHVEAGVTAEVFAPGRRPLLTGIKSMTGHTSGAAGLLNLVVALRAMAAGRVPPITGLRDPIGEVDGFTVVRGEAMPCTASLAQVNAFGFGGVNAVGIVEVAR